MPHDNGNAFNALLTMEKGGIMKRLLIPFLIIVFLFGCDFDGFKEALRFDNSDSEIQLAARRASVQVLMYTPAIKISYTSPLAKDVEFTKETLDKAIEAAEEKLKEYLEEKIRTEIEKENAPRYETNLTSVEDYAYNPKSKTNIPIGALSDVPGWAKFPERILVAYKTEKKDISPWAKEAEKDVLAISEVAGVSISKAKEMLSKIQSEGYTVSKESVSKDSDVVLLHFTPGWSDSYPTTLNWEVKVEGDDCNIITGYNNGVIETRPIPDGKKVYVKAGYFDLKDEFKPKLDEIKRLEREVKRLEIDKKELNDKLEKATRKETKPWKRDIRNATFYDLRTGTIKLEIFWFMGGGSGVYLGNTDLDNRMEGWNYRNFRNVENKSGALILTNAHVVKAGMTQEIWISADNEVMYIVGPGFPSIKYTQHSDSFGSPASILAMDGTPVLSVDYDCAIYVTTPVHGHENNKAVLGDSDKVKTGTRVVMVGNPAMFQKFSTVGIISNVDYPPVNAGILRGVGSLKPTQWIDAPIGAGGTSGSGVWALDGSQRGKVVSLHNSGMMSGVWVSKLKTENDFYDIGEAYNIAWNELPTTEEVLNYSSSKIINISKEQKEKLFKNYTYQDAVFDLKYRDIERKTPDAPFVKMMEDKYYVMVRMDGMSAGIPINGVKAYLQERGIDPDIFKFKGVDNSYWVK